MPRRLLRRAFWHGTGGVLVAAAAAVGMLLAAATAIRAHDTNRFEHRICERVDGLDTAIVAVLQRSLKSLPENAYYLSRPAELSRQQANTRRAIRELEAAGC